MSQDFKIGARARSFQYAARGIRLTLSSQHNAWIHLAASIAVAALGLTIGISRMEWCALVLACSAVWTAEALNTAIEFLADAVSKELHPMIGNAKDVAAGAVLITAIAAAVVGAIVFGPHLAALI